MRQRPLIWLFLTRKLCEIWAENGERRKRKLRDLKKKSDQGLLPCVSQPFLTHFRRVGLMTMMKRRQSRAVGLLVVHGFERKTGMPAHAMRLRPAH